MNLEEKLSKIETLIKQNENASARRQLKALVLHRISRFYLARFANLCWRAGVPGLAIKSLSPLVYPPNNAMTKVTENELLEYACALFRLGAFKESEGILQKLDPIHNSKIWLYYAYCKISQWDYEAAVSPLEQYLSHTKSIDYTFAAAQINLGATLIVLERFSSAETLLQKLVSEFKEKKFDKLFINALELLAQLYIKVRDWKKAELCLETGLQLVKDSKSIEALFFKKWQAILFYSQGQLEMAQQALSLVRKIAEESSHWETIRDADLYLCCINNNQDLAHRLYFGTPFTVFRRKAQSALKIDFQSESFTWVNTNPDQNGSSKQFIDVQRGLLNGKKIFNKSNGALHQLFMLLCTDLYRPFREATVFQSLFPNEHYNQEYARNRIHQLVFRLRQLFATQKIDIEIQNDQAGYKLAFARPFMLRLQLKYFISPMNEDVAVTRLQIDFSHLEYFSTNDLVQAYDCSPRTAQRILKHALNSGQIVKQKHAGRHCYRLQQTELINRAS